MCCKPHHHKYHNQHDHNHHHTTTQRSQPSYLQHRQLHAPPPPPPVVHPCPCDGPTTSFNATPRRPPSRGPGPAAAAPSRCCCRCRPPQAARSPRRRRRPPRSPAPPSCRAMAAEAHSEGTGSRVRRRQAERGNASRQHVWQALECMRMCCQAAQRVVAKPWLGVAVLQVAMCHVVLAQSTR